jgi:hypothetical protein
MPDFFIRSNESLIPTGSLGVPQPASLVKIAQPGVKDGWMQRGYWEKEVGWKEYLLCDSCEKLFQVHEAKARIFLYGNAPGQLKKRILGKAIPLPRWGLPSEVLELREVQIDYRELKLFQMSLLWRAGVASGEFFEQVDLGERHEERLRHLLVCDDPGSAEDYPCIMFDLRTDGCDLEGFWQGPITCRDGTGRQRLYKIVIGGYAFMYSVDSRRPSKQFLDYGAKPGGTMILLVVKGDIFLQRCVARLGRAGKL